MKKKIIGIFVCMLMIIVTALPVTGTLKLEKNESTLGYIISSADSTNGITTSPADLLIIAHEDFCDALKPLKKHKDATGIKTIIESWQSIDIDYQDQGRDVQERIKKRIFDYNKGEDTAWIMLVGDCDKFPVRYVRAYNTKWGNKYFPSDLYYADLLDSNGDFDDWDGGNPPYGGNGTFGEYDWVGFHDNDLDKVNLDKIDGYPDVMVGRVPASNVQEVTTYVNKVKSYEKNAYQSDWNYNALWVVDCGFGSPSKKNRLDVYLTGFSILKRYYCEHPWNTMSDDQRAAEINNVLNGGVGFVNFYGHGNTQSWDLWYDPTKMTGLNNTKMLPVIYAYSCYTGRFHFKRDLYMDVDGDVFTGGDEKPEPRAVQPPIYDEESMAEEFLINRTTGGISYIGCVTEETYGGEDIDKYFFEAYDVYTGTISPTLGYMWNYALTEWMKNVDPLFHHAFYHMHVDMLFGDPSLRVGGCYVPEISMVIKGGIGETAVIINEGDLTIEEGSCLFNTDAIFIPIGKEKRRFPDPIPIPPNETSEAKTGFVFGFGPATITVSADFQIEGGLKCYIVKEATGFVFGPFVLGVRSLPD